MNSIQQINTRFPNWYLILLIPFGFFVGMAVNDFSIATLIIVSGILIFGIYFLLNYELAILIILAIRASLDALNEFELINLSEFQKFNFSSSLAIALIIFYLINYTQRKANLPLVREQKVLVVFLLICAISQIKAPSVVTAFADWLKMFSFFAIIGSIFLLRQKGFGSRSLLKIIVFSSIPSLLFALIQLLTGSGYIRTNKFNIPIQFEVHSVTGLMGNPHGLAFYLLVIIPVIAYVMTKSKSGFTRYFYQGMLLVSCMMVYFTYVKLAWIVLTIQVVLYLLFKKKYFLGIAFLGGLIAAYSLSPVILSRVYEDVYAYQSGATEKMFSGRIMLWDMIINSYWQLPLIDKLFGMGFRSILISLSSSVLAYNVGAHNNFLQLLYEVGLLGFSAFLILQVVILHRIWKVWREGPNNPLSTFAMFMFIVQISVIAMFIGDNTLMGLGVMWYYFSLVGIFLYQNYFIKDLRPDEAVV